MECLKVQELLDAYVDSELPPDSAREVQSHLALCSVCGQEAVMLEQLTADLKDLPKIRMPKSLRRRIIKAFRSVRKEMVPVPRWYELVFQMNGLTCCIAVTGFLVGLFLGGSLMAAPDISGQAGLLALADMEGIF